MKILDRNGGVIFEAEANSFAELIKLAISKGIDLYNIDLCSNSRDGLTNEEWYQLHKEVIRAYYEEDVELKFHSEHFAADGYRDVFGTPSWNTDCHYMVKQKTHTINGMEVPIPMQEIPEKGTKCYFVNITGHHLYGWFNYKGMQQDLEWLERGLLHLTKENAVANAKAMLSFKTKDK